VIWTVTELNQHVRQVLESDYRLKDVWVSGEVSNLSQPSSGHLYFTLKDESGSLRCVMWRPDVSRLLLIPNDGEAVEVHGRISVYEAGGQYQLYADRIRPAGEGVLFREFLRLRDTLEAEGLFAAERKRELPEKPQRIGVVTSPSAAAFRDVIHVLRRRFPMVEVVLSPTPVQGEDAPPKIVTALQALNDYSKPDVILMVRGGGSLEDLKAFNDEAVVRAVASSAAPVVSGIGHETDLILIDFAADVRAPTPSAAAEIVTPDRHELLMDVHELGDRLIKNFKDLVLELRWHLMDRNTALARISPHAKVLNAQQQVDDLSQRAIVAMRYQVSLRKTALGGLTQTLRVIDPSSVLDRGFALVSKQEDGSIVRSVGQVGEGDLLQVKVSDGHFGAVAKSDEQKTKRDGD
jgi:exodeoxyribonuclease VII large subunit